MEFHAAIKRIEMVSSSRHWTDVKMGEPGNSGLEGKMAQISLLCVGPGSHFYLCTCLEEDGGAGDGERGLTSGRTIEYVWHDCRVGTTEGVLRMSKKAGQIVREDQQSVCENATKGLLDSTLMEKQTQKKCTPMHASQKRRLGSMLM